jgi:CHAD domain-containing protein
MNHAAAGHVLLASALRKLSATVWDTRGRVLSSGATRFAANTIDDEALHDFRVALRRMRTYLRTARILWSSKRIERIENELRYFARTTGTLRDDEVLRDTLAGLSLPEAARDEVSVWLARRARATRSRHRSILRIVRDGPSPSETTSEGRKPIRPLDTVLDKLKELLDTEPTQPLAARELARYAVERAIREVVRAAAADVHDVTAMHSLRIREKRLRYITELFANELGDEAPLLTHHATRMQRRLGELHDVDDALGTIMRARGLQKTTQRAAIAALRVARTGCAAKIEPHLIEARGLTAPLALSCNESLPDVST